MNWLNHGSVWTQDHYIPCSLFDLTDPIQFRKCNFFHNLRALGWKENIQKSDTIPPEVTDLEAYIAQMPYSKLGLK